ncbi:hypothetical protein NKR23_g8228 [Pleurostoma richardsiae]|uniref:Coupling of ubiquitin conjugation to ER degradation protein 1 n=1 Tax=Pleurostoma richardsiae TaxID=41990 RepID=A0AA38R9V4_9PEZI|nr:hypothetical protein NKR23_g8228 [Pleurostoma richardsiae]
MANDQINVPSLIVILVLSGLIVRYLFFSTPTPQGQQQGRRQPRDSQAAAARLREANVERIQQMFPQVDRRTILWDLQRTGGSIAATTERILAGRLETPPISFQPPPPPSSSNAASSSSQTQGAKPAEKPAQPDLITRYHLQDKVATATTPSEEQGQTTESTGNSGKKAGWSSSREERQALLQRRREEMILAARRKMEAKIAAEKAAAAGSAPAARTGR